MTYVEENNSCCNGINGNCKIFFSNFTSLHMKLYLKLNLFYNVQFMAGTKAKSLSVCNYLFYGNEAFLTYL